MKKKIKKSPPQKNPRKNLEKEKNDRKYIKRVEEEKMPHQLLKKRTLLSRHTHTQKMNENSFIYMYMDNR